MFPTTLEVCAQFFVSLDDETLDDETCDDIQGMYAVAGASCRRKGEDRFPPPLTPTLLVASHLHRHSYCMRLTQADAKKNKMCDTQSDPSKGFPKRKP